MSCEPPPWPSRPWSPTPHEKTRPLAVRSSECSYPAATSTTCSAGPRLAPAMGGGSGSGAIRIGARTQLPEVLPMPRWESQQGAPWMSMARGQSSASSSGPFRCPPHARTTPPGLTAIEWHVSAEMVTAGRAATASQNWSRARGVSLGLRAGGSCLRPSANARRSMAAGTCCDRIVVLTARACASEHAGRNARMCWTIESGRSSRCSSLDADVGRLRWLRSVDGIRRASSGAVVSVWTGAGRAVWTGQFYFPASWASPTQRHGITEAAVWRPFVMPQKVRQRCGGQTQGGVTSVTESQKVRHVTSPIS